MKNFWQTVNLENKKAVFLDLDNTLYKYEPCHQYALAECYLRLKKIRSISWSEFKAGYSAAQKLVKKNLPTQGAGHSRLLYFHRYFEILYQKSCPRLARDFNKIYWQAFFKKMKLSPGVVPFLNNCRKQNIKICIISDLTTDIQIEKIIYLKLEPYLSYLVTSEEAGVEKPSSAIYKLLLKKTGFKASEALLIGDSGARDISGAKQIGIKALHCY